MRYHYYIILTLLLVACGDDSTDVSTDNEAEVQQVAEETAAPMEELNHFNELPSPLQIAVLFKESGLPYDHDAVLPIAAPEDINGELKELLTFGAHSADLAYASVNDQEQMAIDKLHAIAELSSHFGFASRFNTEENMARFENNIHNLDSIARFIADMEYEVERYIEGNEEEARALVMFSGAWVETLNLGRLVLADSLDESILFQLFDQQGVSQSLYENLERAESLKDMPGYDRLMIEMQTLNGYFQELDLSNPEEIVIERTWLIPFLEDIGEAREKLLE